VPVGKPKQQGAPKEPYNNRELITLFSAEPGDIFFSVALTVSKAQPEGVRKLFMSRGYQRKLWRLWSPEIITAYQPCKLSILILSFLKN